MKKIFYILVFTILLLNFSSVKTEPTYSHTRENNFIWTSYYLVDGQNVFYLDTNDFKIYLSDKDRKNNKKIIDDNIDDTGFILYDGKIIFKNVKDGYLYSYEISNELTKKMSQFRLADKYGSFFVLKDKIYYYDEFNYLHKIYNGRDYDGMPAENKIAMNIQENQILLDNNILLTWGNNGINLIDINNYEVKKIYFSSIYSLAVYKNRIYFIDQDKRVCSIDFEGNDLTVVSEDRAVEDSGEIISGKLMIDENKLYYISYKDSDSELICMDLESNKKELVIRNVADFYVDKDRIFYFESYDSEKLYENFNNNLVELKTEGKNFLSILELKNDLLFVLEKSQNHVNLYGEVDFLNINKN